MAELISSRMCTFICPETLSGPRSEQFSERETRVNCELRRKIIYKNYHRYILTVKRNCLLSFKYIPQILPGLSTFFSTAFEKYVIFMFFLTANAFQLEILVASVEST